MVALVNVETEPGRWESVRSIYITAVFKFKIVKDGSLQFVFSPKNIEISELKVMNGDQEEPMEQMMIQSVANIQLDAFKNKKLLDYPIDINNLL